jgi:hypothetical protein
MNLELKLIDPDNHPNEERPKHLLSCAWTMLFSRPWNYTRKKMAGTGVRDGRHRIWTAHMISGENTARGNVASYWMIFTLPVGCVLIYHYDPAAGAADFSRHAPVF